LGRTCRAPVVRNNCREAVGPFQGSSSSRRRMHSCQAFACPRRPNMRAPLNGRFAETRPAAQGRQRSADPRRRTAARQSTAALRASMAALGQSAAARANALNCGSRPRAVVCHCTEISHKPDTRTGHAGQLLVVSESGLHPWDACPRSIDERRTLCSAI